MQHFPAPHPPIYFELIQSSNALSKYICHPFFILGTGKLEPPPNSNLEETENAQIKPTLTDASDDLNIPVGYEHLVCTNQDKEIIIEIITTVANFGKISLLSKKSYLNYLGEQISHVHPLKFLVISLSSDELKICLAKIFSDYFKRNGLMDGIGANLSREANQGKLEMYIPAFAKEMGVSIDDIMPYFESQDWIGLVRFLINRSLA